MFSSMLLSITWRVWMSNVAVVVPEYNEPELESRLNVFNELGESLAGTADVVVVDDASTNGNREVLAQYVKDNNPSFKPFYMEENGKKVRAVQSAINALHQEVETVILTDIDTYLQITPEEVTRVRDDLQASPDTVGGTFKLIPANSNGLLRRLQTTEYEVSRSIQRFLKKEGKSFVIPGASAVYKRKPLEDLLQQHSGKHNGDDKELTILAFKNGWKVTYWDDIEAKTIVPSQISTLINQRARYALGTLETYEKELPAYVGEAASVIKGKRFGFLTGMQIKSTIAFPLGLYFLAKAVGDNSFNPESLGQYWAVDTAVTSGFLLYGRKEVENKMATMLTVPFMPVYKMGVLAPARVLGYLKFAAQGFSELIPKTQIGQDSHEKISGAYRTITTGASKAVNASVSLVRHDK